MEGYETPEMHGKHSLRASATGELIFNDVKVPKDNIFTEKTRNSLQLQANHYNTEWSIETRLKEWEVFLEQADANSA